MNCRMSNIFYNNFKEHYLLKSIHKKCEKRNNYNRFELLDISKELHINVNHSSIGMGKYDNISNKEILFFDYDKFFSKLPATINNNKQRCDVILYTLSDKSYFILNELKDKNNSTGKKRRGIRKDARDQLIDTLIELYSIPNISSFINSFTNKISITSNAQPYSATIIGSALSSFNPLSRIAPNGLNLSHAIINSFGFDYWDLIGNQSFKIK